MRQATKEAGDVNPALIEYMVNAYEPDRREEARARIEQFFYYRKQYPEYARKLTSNAPINTSTHPDMDYAARMSGLSYQFVRSCEWSFESTLKRELDAAIEQGNYSPWYSITRLATKLAGDVQTGNLKEALKSVRSEQAALAKTEESEFKQAYKAFLKETRR